MSSKINTNLVDIERNDDVITHRLSSTRPGESEVEQIAEKIEKRREERVDITFSARVRFLHDCRMIAKNQGYDTARISAMDLQDYRERVAMEVERKRGLLNVWFLKAVGIIADADVLLKLLDRALEVMESSDLDENWFHYVDFNNFNTRVVSRWPWLRTELRVAALVIVCYYFFTPILFCNMMGQSNICEGGSLYSGWMSALYFASTTLSTVGYGDLTVDQEPRWKAFIGSVYMLLSMVVAVIAFSAAAGATLSPLERLFDKIFDRFRDKNDEKFLYKRIRRLKFIKIFELLSQVFTFILIGVFASQIAVKYEDNPDAQWTWMTSFYWAIQTTTTIGYGDLTQPYGLRWFKIFYLMFSTYLVGSSLGRLGSLKSELSYTRRYHAWEKRRVTKRYVDEMQAYQHDDKIDQYEFLVASLVSLGKLSSDDIHPIMTKYRDLAGDKGFISIAQDVVDESIDASDAEDVEEDVIDQEE